MAHEKAPVPARCWSCEVEFAVPAAMLTQDSPGWVYGRRGVRIPYPCPECSTHAFFMRESDGLEAPPVFETIRVRCANCCLLHEVDVDTPITGRSTHAAGKSGHYLNAYCGECGSQLFLPDDGSLSDSWSVGGNGNARRIEQALTEGGVGELADWNSRLSALARAHYTGWAYRFETWRTWRAFALLPILEALSVGRMQATGPCWDIERRRWVNRDGRFAMAPAEEGVRRAKLALAEGQDLPAAFRAFLALTGLSAAGYLDGLRQHDASLIELSDDDLAPLLLIAQAPDRKDRANRLYGFLETLALVVEPRLTDSHGSKEV